MLNFILIFLTFCKEYIYKKAKSHHDVTLTSKARSGFRNKSWSGLNRSRLMFPWFCQGVLTSRMRPSQKIYDVYCRVKFNNFKEVESCKR